MSDQYLINIQFAEELLNFLCTEVKLLFGFKIRWYPKYFILDMKKEMEIYDSMFDDEIGFAVFYIINENSEDIIACYEEFFDDVLKQPRGEDIDDVNFTNYAIKIASSFFSDGYSHGSFLAFCAMVIGVAYNFLVLKPNCIPARACQVVALVLFAHQMTGQFYEKKGWEGFYETASNLNATSEKYTAEC